MRIKTFTNGKKRACIDISLPRIFRLMYGMCPYDYLPRFYERQLITRHKVNSDVLSSFETALKEYYKDGRADDGIPSVAYRCISDLRPQKPLLRTKMPT